MASKHDKITNNSFNAGTVESTAIEPIALSEYYKRTYFKKEYAPQESYQIDKLVDIIIEILKETRYYDMLSEQKDIKNNISNILELILLQLEQYDNFTFIEKFYCLCEVLPINEQFIYKMLPFKYKNIALKELDENYIKIEKKYESMKLF